MLDGKSEVIVSHVDISGEWLSIRWEDGHDSRFHATWLRHACACKECGDYELGFRHRLIKDIPENIVPGQVSVKDGSVRVEWLPDHHVSFYSPANLRRACNSDRERENRRFSLESWSGEIVENLPVVRYPDVLGDDRHHLGLLEKLLRYGFVLLEDVPVEPDEISNLTNLVGEYRAGTYGLYEIKVKDTPYYYGDLNVALDPHCDETYRVQTAAITVFLPLVVSEEGGESILVDGMKVAEVMKEQHPEAFQLLSEAPVTFRRREEDNHFFQTRAPIIALERDGTFAGVRFLDRYLMPLDVPEALVVPYYDAIRTLERYLTDPVNQTQFKLHPGQAMAFNNQRVLHGRTEIGMTGSRRHLRHCNTDLDSFYSKLRLLYAKHNRREAVMIFPSGARL